MRVAVINVPVSVGRRAWADCFNETADRADLFGINESLTLRQRRTYRRLARKRGLRVAGLWSTPNPVFSNPKVWKRRHASAHRLHGRGPMFARWPGFNAPRSATVGVYRYVGPNLHRTPDVTVINTHWVPRGGKVPARWRASARDRSEARVARIVRAHTRRGRVVVPLGDFNMDPAPNLPGVTWVIGAHHGVDKIGVACPAGWRIGARRGDHFRAPTDHGAGVSADVEVTRA